MFLEFYKYHGCGNDFVIFDFRNQYFDLAKLNIKNIAHRNFGIGCDQVVFILKDLIHDCKLLIYNEDGSESFMCGNVMRCVADIINKKEIYIKTKIRLVKVIKDNEYFFVNMGKVSFEMKNNFYEGFIGNKHCVYISKYSEEIFNSISNEYKDEFNISFVEIINKDSIKLQTYERGVGWTLSCGSAASVTHYILYNQNLVNKKIDVLLQGGLLVTMINENNEVILGGVASLVYKGEYYVL